MEEKKIRARTYNSLTYSLQTHQMIPAVHVSGQNAKV
jgi:hypothetical protein